MSIQLIYYFASILFATLWTAIWLMHIFALANARLKLNRSAAATQRAVALMPHAADLHINKRTSSKHKRDHQQANIDGARRHHHHHQQLFCCLDQSLLGPAPLPPLPGVSIIKPIVGIDDANLPQNLETFFHLDYAHYEILFCIQDPYDPATSVVERLMSKYSHMDTKLFVGGANVPVGVNPKINNMQPAYEMAKYELILISDSGIAMRRDTLLDMVCHMADDIALVHQMPYVYKSNQNDFCSNLERVYFGTVHARAYLFSDFVGINCSTGMSALMRKCLLDEVGGIRAFANYLAEDFFFAKSFMDRGWRLSISSQPALQNSATSSATLGAFNERVKRWIKLRLAMLPFLTIVEPFSECLLLGLTGAWAISSIWTGLNPVLVFTLHVVVWFLFDCLLIRTIQNGPLTCSWFQFVVAWTFRESTALFVFLGAVLNPKVTWRSRQFKLRWGGLAEGLEVVEAKVDLIGAFGGKAGEHAPSEKQVPVRVSLAACGGSWPT